MTTVLVLPINSTVETPNGLDKGEEDVFRFLVEYVRQQGPDVRTVSSGAFRDAVAIASEVATREMMAGRSTTASEKLGFSEITPPLLSELGIEADLVIVPNLVMRSGRVERGRSVRWDGVKRRKPGATELEWYSSNDDPAVSLWVLVYDHSGEKVFSGFGGLDVLFELDVQQERQVLFEERLEDPDDIWEGVCVAFHPFFGEDERCYRDAPVTPTE